jgi:hypothetical protein
MLTLMEIQMAPATYFLRGIVGPILLMVSVQDIKSKLVQDFILGKDTIIDIKAKSPESGNFRQRKDLKGTKQEMNGWIHASVS